MKAEPEPGTPRWVWLIIVLIAAIDPLQHFWLYLWAPAGWAHTGFHIGDTPFFLTAMDMFNSGFASPYAVSGSPLGAASASYFALPHHWLYGVLGTLATLLHVPHFLALGVLNGAGGALYLYAVYRFLAAVQPVLARRAFVLFTLGGGLAGWVYAGAWFVGLDQTAGFEMNFHRLARYELIEGPFIAPLLVMPRFYYTAPLALGFAALTRLSRRDAGADWIVLVLLFVTAFFNARLGALFWGAATCFVITRPWSRRHQARAAVRLLLPVLIGGGMALLLLRQNPSATENVDLLLRRTAWAGSLATLLCWHLVTVPLALGPSVRTMPQLLRSLAGALLGYLFAFAVLYVLHQGYYGNVFHGGETAAAIAISDWALIGTLPGVFLASRGAKRDTGHRDDPLDWIVLWFLGLLVFSIAAFAQGRFLSMMPERGLILLGPPLALISAQGWKRLQERWPVSARLWSGTVVASGLLSIAVAALCFQGPLRQSRDGRAFPWVHSEIVAQEDVDVIGRIPGGVVLAPASLPPLLGDVVVHQRPGTRTVLGQPSLEFSGTNMLELIGRVQEFYRPDCSDEVRRTVIRQWGVDYVMCPATWPVEAQTLAQFRAAPWMEEAIHAGKAVLFKISKEGDGP
ncbi:MAG: hypothetical protein HYV27_25115 [Candidatus Hydrogenedentes bacterium]|nr:hypothetical protein [Candidatus Hydrogenedentota bacterium]